MRLLAVLLTFGLAGPALCADATDQAIRDALGGDPAAYRAVFAGFQSAVAKGDAKAAAAYVDFPIDATIGGRKRAVKTASAFAAEYAKIVTPGIAAAVRDARWDDLVVNAEGVTLGDGEVWISGVCRDKACARVDVRVIAIQPGP